MNHLIQERYHFDFDNITKTQAALWIAFGGSIKL